MSFQITGPGFYLQRNGGKAEIAGRVSDGRWVGISSDFGVAWWQADGSVFAGVNRPYDIVAVWHEAPEPPEGFVIQPREYVAKEGDYGRHGKDQCWHKIDLYGGWNGKSAASMDKAWPDYAPYLFASPIPAPFRISDHGCGVYQQRDGKLARVVRRFGETGWSSRPGGAGFEWFDSGCVFESRVESHNDLVRYIGPLPEKWAPTMERRLRRIETPVVGAKWVCADEKLHGRMMLVIDEQKWTSGDREEWRPVSVQ